MEPICAILGIIISIVVLTVAGHCFWLLFAAIYRAIFGGSSTSNDAWSTSHSSNSSHGTEPRIADDLQAAKRLIDYAGLNGWMSPDQLAALNRLIEDYGKRVTAQPEISPVRSDISPVRPAELKPSVAGPPPLVTPVHPLDEPEPTVAPSAVPKKRAAVPTSNAPIGVTGSAVTPDAPVERPVKPRGVPLSANLMRAFMEQSNIRWIELISASLIVVCSVGLVISLWSTLSATSRFFPSLVFLLATAAVHAAGQYTLRKWKLRSTSRGILHIGLMLIPLAVLVGILLSERDGQPPQLDTTTVAVIAAGTIVYGGAAVTAARALFASRYLLVAAAVIFGAMTLIPIHFLGASQRLEQPLTTVILFPMVAVVLFTALHLSQTVRRQTSSSSGRSRRMATQVLQVLFASAVPAYFWMMRAGGISATSDTAISVVGLVLAGWASWGWTASLAGSASRTNSPVPRDKRQPEPVQLAGQAVLHSLGSSSWLNVLAWGLAFCCTLGLAAILWQTSGSRLVFAGLLLALMAWWLCHGWRCNLFLSHLAGSLAGIVAMALWLEWTVPSAMDQLNPTDWFTLSRIACLSISSALFGAVGAAILLLKVSRDSRANLAATQSSVKQSPNLLALSFLSGCGLSLIGTTVLITLASLVPWSSPAYGGNWAPLLLILNGFVLLGAGTGWAVWVSAADVESHDARAPRNLGAALFPVGQAILLLGAVRLCQSAPMLPEWIADLRPLRAWSVGAGLVAIVWGVLAGLLRYLSPRSDNRPGSLSDWMPIRSLCLGSVALSLLCGLCYWTTWDRFELASSLGWIVPAAFALSFFAIRDGHFREWSVVGTAVWIVTLLIHLGLRRAWWEPLGLSSTVSILVLSVLAILWVYQFLLKADATNQKWWGSGPRWASELLLNTSWTALLGSLISPIGLQLWNSLSSNATASSSTDFVLAPLNLTRSGTVLLAIAALSGCTYWLRLARSDLLRLWLAVVPVVLASLVGCITPLPYSVPAFLWVLAVAMIAMELLSLTRTAWGRRLCELGQLLAKGKLPTSSDRWIALAGLTGFWVLVMGTIIVYWSHAVGRIPQPLNTLTANMATWSGWVVNLSIVALWMGPVTMLLAVRWFVGIWLSSPAKAVTQLGFALGVTLTLASVTAGASSPQHIVLLGLQSFTLVMVALSWKTLSFATAWNWFGLRQLDKLSSARQLLSKACGGARWRSAEQAAWKLWMGSICAATVLSLASAAMIVVYPQNALYELHQLGGVWTLISVGLAIALGWLLGLQRGISKFGILALTLGMVAPILAAGYASWLMTHPSAKFALAANHEPYRLLVGLWLVSLAFGLVIRVRSRLRNESISGWGEHAWVGLAIVVGCLAIFGLRLDSSWASAQLAVLAVIIALSAEASGKTWRGWIAALAGTLAWAPWISGGGWSDWIHYPWQALWGGTSVGLISVAARRSLERLQYGHQETNPPEARSHWWTIDRAACVVVSLVSMALSGLWILQQSNTLAAPTAATWVVAGLLLANLLLAMARLWDVGPSQRGLSVYLAVLAATVVLVNTAASYGELPRLETELAWLGGFLGAMTVMATLLREISLQRLPIQRFFHWNDLATEDKLQRAGEGMAIWHTIAGLVCLVPSIWLVLNIPNQALRIAAIALPMLGATAILPVSNEVRRWFQRGSVLLLVSATLILAWWADLPAAWTVRAEHQSWLFVHRTFLALVALSIVYPMVAWRRSLKSGASQASLAQEVSARSPNSKSFDFNLDSWTPALIIGGWACLASALAVGIGMIVGTGLNHWSAFPTNVSLVVKILTLIAWAMIFARLIQAAARPFSIDRLTDLRSRSVMVYLAEGVLVLGGLAAYQHFPDLFSGIFLPWWPLIVFGIAFLSAGIGQLLQRAKHPVLADPIHQSSLLLPLIPLAGVWWARQDSSAAYWGEWGSYWLLLAAASSLYGLYGWMRNSVWLRVMSVGAALLSFWALLLSRPDLQFFDRPQVWLLPPAVGTLLFVEWNRKKLDANTVTVSRYLCILVAYLSSSAEVFLKAVEGNLWQPILLLFLALSGAIAGMLLRIRAFLYCGVAFIMVALFGMVWHAAQAIDQVWPWWVFGIATGVGLIVLMGYFEKNRPKVLKYLEELKSWQK